MSGAAGAGAAAAAAAEARRRRQEEEEMTPYTKQDLAGDWEFKIIRSATNTFKDPQKMKAILDEEARAGWVMVEKFDNQRIRLKRPHSARAADATLGFDPYRTQVGTSELALAGIILALVLGGLGILIAIVAAIANR